MKMVSQLTRQAMSRHRLLAAGRTEAPASAPGAPDDIVRPLYPPPDAAPPAPHPPIGQPPRPAPQPAPQQRTIYGALMKKHDQFTDRHLPGR